MSVAVLEKFYDPLTSLKLFTEGQEFDRNIWWKIEYNCDKNGKVTTEITRELYFGKPPIYVPEYISFMPAMKKK